jgi:hypothetical protein
LTVGGAACDPAEQISLWLLLFLVPAVVAVALLVRAIGDRWWKFADAGSAKPRMTRGRAPIENPQASPAKVL